MKRHFFAKQLLEILHTEHALIVDLLTYTELQKEALVTMDLAGLEEACRCQQNIAESLREKEFERVNLIAKEQDVPLAEAATVQISGLLTEADEQYRRELQQLQRLLRVKARELHDIQKTNRVLTERARKFVKETLRIITNDGMSLYNARV